MFLFLRNAACDKVSHGLHGFTQISSSLVFIHGWVRIYTDFVPSERRLFVAQPHPGRVAHISPG